MVMETLPQGTILNGHYRIERALGSGGFGHVYLSADLNTNQQYAIKEYLVTGASGKAQLEHEARVLSQLHHPNLPAFQDAFAERDRYYIVIGYIEGSDLTDLIRIVRQRNEIILTARILEWIISICDAVSFLHNHVPPVIHRDIKPDNIRITSDGKAILVDLGNAKAIADGARTLFFIRHQGTPGYAPLEQYPGGTGTDTRSDVYALGGTLYFALTTHEPPNVSTRNQSIQQKLTDLPSLQEQLAHNPPESSQNPNTARQFRLGVTKPAKPAPRHSRHIAQLDALPPEQLDLLNAIIQKAMAMKPKERYQSVSEMSNDLKLVLSSLQASMQPPLPISGRPIDPHSTQPDLPQLFESMQNNQAPKDHSTHDASTAVSVPQSQPSHISSTQTHCPRCNAEIRRQAAFCPQCGLSLSKKAPEDILPSATPTQTPTSINSNEANSRQGNVRMQPDTPVNTSLSALPRLTDTSSELADQSQGLADSHMTISPNPPQKMIRSQMQLSAQNTVFSPAPSQIPPKSFIQTSIPTLVQDVPATQEPILTSPPQSMSQDNSTGSRKILLYIAIAFVVVLLIVMFVVLQGFSHS